MTNAALTPHWAASLAKLPTDAPLILIANELLDCLPVRQFVRTQAGWAERAVGLDADGELSFGLAPCDDRVLPADAAQPGELVEDSAAQIAFAAELAIRIARQGGAALLIDYGAANREPGDTLQALKRHEKVGVLECPGEADLTVHADFAAVLTAAKANGAATAFLEQGELLRRLGIEARAAALARAQPERAETIARQLARLTAPEQMGCLFKAACLYAPNQPPPPGFEVSQ